MIVFLAIQNIFTSLQRGRCVVVVVIVVVSESEWLSDLKGAVNRRGANDADLTPTIAKSVVTRGGA